MGCPPDPGEVSYYRTQERLHVLEEEIRDLQKEIREAKERMEQLMLQSEPDASSLKKGLEEAEKVLADIPEPPASKESYMASDMYGDVAWIYAIESHTQKIKKQHETALCILNDAFLFYSQQLKDPEVSLQSKVEEVLQKHKAHRKDDRKTWLTWLEDQKTKAKGLFKHPTRKEKAKAHFKKIEAEILRVQKLPEEAVLKDRKVFGTHPEEFDTSKNT